ncbi:hypothetical protein AAMO2058_001558300 [Amorphochlora amoebiformis]
MPAILLESPESWNAFRAPCHNLNHHSTRVKPFKDAPAARQRNSYPFRDTHWQEASLPARPTSCDGSPLMSPHHKRAETVVRKNVGRVQARLMILENRVLPTQVIMLVKNRNEQIGEK